jgi:hypothetical protein
MVVRLLLGEKFLQQASRMQKIYSLLRRVSDPLLQFHSEDSRASAAHLEAL